MKKVLLLTVSLALTISNVFSQEVPLMHPQKAFGKIDYMSIKMPQLEIPNEQNMGFTGIHYNLMLNKWSYAGVGIYGSVTGQRGGFFTLGVNAGIKKHIAEKWFVDTGFHIGAGGGAAAADGGGIFILPHINLGHKFSRFSVTAGYNYINFFDKGKIANHQYNLAVQIPLSFEHALHTEKEKSFKIAELNSTRWNQKAKKLSLTFHLNNLKVTSKAKATTGEVLNGKTIRLAGFELNSYLNKNWFAFVKVDGAYKGIRAGYMDVLLGGGYHWSLNKNNTHLITKFGIGAGGGGGVDTKGGFLLYPDISIEQRIYENVFLSINKGFLFTPDRYFASSTFGAGIKYYLHTNGTKSTKNSFRMGIFKGFETSVGHDIYLNVKRDVRPTENMHQISMQVNFELNKNTYVAGQTSFASFGDAGAYAEGLVGLGLKIHPFYHQKIKIFAQFIGGGAGGGGISTGQGLIIKPSVGIQYKMNNVLDFQASGGFVKALGANLNSPFTNIGIAYHFSFLKLN